MEDIPEKIRVWLDLTQQQFDILQSVYRLQLDDLQASPKAIQQEYKGKTGKYIQKPNLFNILKLLVGRGYVTKKGYSNYSVDFESIGETLDKKKVEYYTNLKEFEKLSGEVERFFLKLSETSRHPTVDFLEYKTFFDTVTKQLQKSERYYITAKFPGIGYTLEPYVAIGRGEILKTLWDRCFEKRDLEVSYLTCLDPEYPYTHALKAYGDKERAYRECKTIFNQLENQIETYDNLRVYYLENPYGLDIILPEGRHLENLFMFIRDSHMEVTGGIHIKSRDIAGRAKETFQALCRQATLLRGRKGKRIINKKRRELKERYG